MPELLLVPKTYNTVAINDKGTIDCQTFQIPRPKALSGLRQVAGGTIFDFHYGTGSKLMPQPFQLTMMVTGQSAAAMYVNWNVFFNLYGGVYTFVADVHGKVPTATMSCEAELTDVQYTQNARWYSTDMYRMSGIKVTMTPLELFS